MIFEQERAAAVSRYCGSSFQIIPVEAVLWFRLKMILDFRVIIPDGITGIIPCIGFAALDIVGPKVFFSVVISGKFIGICLNGPEYFQVPVFRSCIHIDIDQPVLIGMIRLMTDCIQQIPGGVIQQAVHADDNVMVGIPIEDVMLGEVEIAEQKFNCVVDCVVSTQFGGLEILFPRDGVEPEQYQYIKIGAFIDCYAYLSGDAAIHQHGTGIVRDKDSNLRLVAFTFGGGAPERLERVMASDVRFDSECSDTHLSEREEIMSFMKEVQKDGPRCYPKYAIIAGKADDLGPGGGLKGIALYYEGNNECSGVAAVTSDAEGFITSISVSRADQISFQLIEQEEETETGTVLDLKDSILARAHMFRLVEDDVSVSDVESYIQAHKDELTGFRNCPDENRPMEDVFTDAYNKGLQRSGHEGLSEKETASIGQMFYNDYARTDSCEMQDILCFIECIGAMYRGRAD